MNAPSIETVVERLAARYPEATYELNWETPLQMLVATILAAQCTDERVNRVTADLFPKYPDAAAFAAADRETLEQEIKSTGFFRQKAKTVQEVCAALVEGHAGAVPRDMDALVALPGVARKTANVVLATVWDEPAGVIVDTHVKRLCQRLGLTTQKNADKIERELMDALPEDRWTWFGPAAVLFGRYTCKAKTPDCEVCELADVCPRVGVEVGV